MGTCIGAIGVSWIVYANVVFGDYLAQPGVITHNAVPGGLISNIRHCLANSHNITEEGISKRTSSLEIRSTDSLSSAYST